MAQFALMQAMAFRIEHLIDSGPLPAERAAPLEPRTNGVSAPGPMPIPCQIVDVLAGDCASPLGERLRLVEAECGFGQRCARGCQTLEPAYCGVVGGARVRIAQIAPARSLEKAGNDSGF